MTQILMNDFKAEPAEIRAAMLAATSRVLESGWYVLGQEVQAFERQWAQACGLPHGIGVGNGMDAIEIALRAAGIGAGDEVITTPMTAFATVLAVLRAGATPVLADIDPETGLLDPDSVERCIGPRTRAVLLVHLYGQVRDMARWVALTQRRRVLLVEDCAQAHLAREGSTVAGGFGVAGAYSFYPTKNLGAPGDAGMVVAADGALAERMRQLRNYGQSVRYEHPVLGMNSRLDEVQAAMLAARLPWLEGFTQRRREIAQAYDRGLRHAAVQPLAPPLAAEQHVHHLYVVRCEQRQALQQHLTDQGVQALIHYPIPVHRQQPCLDLKRDPQGLPHADAHARICLSLPCHPQMSDADVERVIKAVNGFAGA